MQPLCKVKDKRRKISNSDLRFARELVDTLFEHFEFYDQCTCTGYSESDLEHDAKVTINDLVNALHMEF